MGRSWTVVVRVYRLHRGRPCRWMPRGKNVFFLQWGQWELELTSLPFKGICVTAVWRRGERLARPTAPRLKWEYPSMAIRKRTAQLTLVKHLAAMETGILHDVMPLVEHCALRQYEDGSEREPGWVTIKCTGAAWVVQVKDPDTACSFSAVADTVDKALETAALLLAADEAPWEPDQWLARQRAEKKKK